ncbi:D-aminoacylase [Desulfuribacillus stibiiarsenatis]|uniref:D-aminoacylase n=1 Tax=Desulfuribacillus stibiiarsenatis TaxID=1390249 RepID=A0A1E5L2U7_9FIRM|nr:D-aminoacylase [Desulfuribacillus stibiiarsenatis]
MFDIVLKNGRIVDGTGSPWFYGDIGITEDRIQYIGKIASEHGHTVYDVSGHYISPGFIDMHSHSDLYILEQPYLSAKVRQGITTELLGQDGIAATPLPKQYVTDWKGNLAGLDGEPNIEWDWTDVKSYLERIEQVMPSHNLAFLVPHGNIRMEAMGLEGRAATPQEIAAMKQLLRTALEQGACGISSGLIYYPCVFADTNELTALCEVAAEYGVPFVVHQRSEGDEIVESMMELINIAEHTKAHLHFSHFKVCGEKNWNKTAIVLKKIDEARTKGIEITFDQYPYTAGSTMLSAILPPWVHEGGTSSMLNRLKDKSARERIKKEMAEGFSGWDSIAAWATWKGIYITSVKTAANQDCIGKHIEEISQLRNVSDPADMALRLIEEEENAVGMIDFVMDESSIGHIMNHPVGTICTDGLLGGKPHPRAYGAFPRILAKYVRNDQVIGLEQAIRRMTSQPARIIGCSDRGVIREGLKADLVVFSLDGVQDTATFEDSRQAPMGIDYVIINGEVVVEGDAEVHVPAGKVIRRTYYTQC